MNREVLSSKLKDKLKHSVVAGLLIASGVVSTVEVEDIGLTPSNQPISADCAELIAPLQEIVLDSISAFAEVDRIGNHYPENLYNDIESASSYNQITDILESTFSGVEFAVSVNPYRQIGHEADKPSVDQYRYFAEEYHRAYSNLSVDLYRESIFISDVYFWSMNPGKGVTQAFYDVSEDEGEEITYTQFYTRDKFTKLSESIAHEYGHNLSRSISGSDPETYAIMRTAMACLTPADMPYGIYEDSDEARRIELSLHTVEDDKNADNEEDIFMSIYSMSLSKEDRANVFRHYAPEYSERVFVSDIENPASRLNYKVIVYFAGLLSLSPDAMGSFSFDYSTQ